MTKTLYIIDYFAQLFRAYHAIRTGMSSPVTKEPTNATFGYVGMLLKVLREYKPDYLIVAMDKSGDRETFRSTIYPEYKANREPPPLDFRPQASRCIELTEMLGIPVFGVETFEADDVIASLVTHLRAEQPDLHIRIVSKDKDLEQLLDDHVAIADVHKDELITVETLLDKKGITPAQVIDMLALMGDTVDNVPGVKGIGPKTAAQLIHEYGTLDNLLANLEEIKGKRRENIEAAREMLPMSRELVTLRRDVPLDIDLDRAAVRVEAIPVQQVLAAFKELGFNRLQDELRAVVGGAEAEEAAPAAKAPPKAPAAEPGGLFSHLVDEERSDHQARRETKRGKYECVRTLKQLDEVIKRLASAPIISIDTETTGIDPMRAQLCGVCLSIEAGSGWYIPVRSPEPGTHLDAAMVLERLRPILVDPSKPKCGHNIKYDWIIFRQAGIELRGMAVDTMIASYVVDSSRPSHGLDPLAQALLHYHCIPISDLIGHAARGKPQKCFDEVPLELATEYAAEDADVTLRLWECFEPQLAAMKLRKLFDEVEMPLVEVLAAMEHSGIRVDPDILDQQRQLLAKRIDSLRQSLIDAAPHAFNPDSPKQLAAALFNASTADPPGLGLKILKKGKTGPSTDIEVLEKLAADPNIDSPIPQLIVEYRQLTKLVNTYLVALKECISPDTGRIHASFNQTVAATGRLSSSDPNLQNIPIRTDVGRQIRAAFVAPPAYQLITADYSQIELRLLAHLSQDEGLIEAFRSDQDIHTAVAAYVHGVEPGSVTREQRNSAKMVNFGIIYGITAFGLARRLGQGVSNEQAARIIADYKARYPGIDVFLQECVAKAHRLGYVETMLGRRRAVPQVTSRNPNERQLGERIAINSVVQGSAADLIKLAMIDLHRQLPARFPAARMLLQIHDELVFEVPEQDVPRVLPFVVERMESAMQLRVPLKVEAAAAENWLEGK
ncbi:MAG: DNA polymerase I [Phycisphaerales bacterium]|nr:DNA polymerase I [Phycisphaerales bacterium]